MPHRVRVSLCRNSGAKRHQVQAAVVVEASHAAIVQAAKNKLRLSKAETARARLFLLKRTSYAKAGVELPRDGALASLLDPDVVIAVSTGENFIRADGYSEPSDADPAGVAGAPPGRHVALAVARAPLRAVDPEPA